MKVGAREPSRDARSRAATPAWEGAAKQVATSKG